MKQTVKVLLLLLLVFFNYEIFLFTCQTVSGTILTDDSSRQWQWMHEKAAEGTYGDLRNSMNLYELYGEEYDGLWNVTEAGHYYGLYTAAVQAAQKSEHPDFSKRCEAQAARALELLRKMPENTGDVTADTAIRKIKGRVPD